MTSNRTAPGDAGPSRQTTGLTDQRLLPAPTAELRAESLAASAGSHPADARRATQVAGFGRLRRNLTGLATLLFLAAAAEAAPDIEVNWRGEEYAAEALPPGLAAPAAEAIAAWATWADAHGYRMDLTDDGRVLLLSEGKRLSKSTWKVLESALAAYDAMLPPATRLEAAAREASVGLHAARETAPAERPTVVLVQVDSDEDQVDLLDHLTHVAPYLATWTGQARGMVGFTLERPLVAAWQRKPSGVDEWDPNNELAHRLGALLVLRDHGRLPHWLSRGLAWAIEIATEGDVACFPDRSSFVFAAEHGAWPSNAKTLARRLLENDRVLTLERLASFERGVWDGDLAVLSFGVARYLTDAKPGFLPVLLAELEQARIQGSTTYFPDGSWKTEGDFRLDAEAQRAIFSKHLGEDFETEWTLALAEKRR